MIRCDECGAQVAVEDVFICLIGARLCPTCQVKQQRFSLHAHMDLTDWMMVHYKDTDGWTADECEGGDGCKCRLCEYERAYAIEVAKFVQVGRTYVA